MKGGKRPGAGRPPVERPKPVSWRPKTQEQRDKYIALGGAKWLSEAVEDAHYDSPVYRIPEERALMQEQITNLQRLLLENV